MPADPSADPWSGDPYNVRFDDRARPAAAPGAASAPAVARRPSTRTLMIGGIAAAAALGVALGFFSRPTHLNTAGGPEPAPMKAVTEPGQVQIAVAPAPANAVPQAGRLDVLPRSEARSTPPPPAPAAPIAPSTLSAPQVLNIGPEDAPPAAAPPIPDVQPAPPPLRASFDCATARPGAERMVCADPGLAAADRALARAYRRALESGVDPVDLRGEQRDWLAIREDAARRSPRALASVYDQRIDELNRMADDADN